MIKYYNLHDTIHLRVINPSKIFDRLKMFECEPFSNIDIDVVIGPFNVDLRNLEKSGIAYRNYNTFYVDYRHKLSFWSILIENFEESKTTILFDGDPFFSSELLLMLVLEPLFAYKASKKGVIVLHASALSVNNKGCLFTGDTGIGKTSILLKLLDNKNTEYYADDQTFIIDDLLHAYPVPIGFRKHLKERNKVVVSKWNEVILEFHSIFNALTSFYGNLTQRIPAEEIRFESGVQVVPGDTAPLKNVFILNKTDGKAGVEKITGSVAYPLILKANNKNEDKLKMLFRYVSLYRDQMAEQFWNCFEYNLKTLTHSEGINFYQVKLNQAYDYAETLETIREIING